jgi:histidinol-phosphate aminotransferase
MILLWYNFAMDIRKLIKPNIAALKAYQAKEIPCRVKLDANESPYGFDNAWKTLKSVMTNRYPDPDALSLKKRIAQDFKIKPGMILQGNGSDELIYYLIAAFGGPVLYPVPTFSMYGIIAQALDQKKTEILLDERLDLDTKRMFSEIRKEKPGIIFLSSPNNPTGNCFSSDRILKIIDATASKSLVVVDEAYQPFASKRGFIPLLKDYGNLIIMRTLSKIGLAGLRVGFLIAGEDIIREVNKVRLPFNLNALSQALALEVLKDKKRVSNNIRAIISERDRLFRELSRIAGIKPYPSEANFILFRVKDPGRIWKELLREGVLVRDMKGVVDGCLRVTVGSPEENRIFIDVLKKIKNI